MPDSGHIDRVVPMSDALLSVVSRLGAVEQGMRDKPSHEQLTRSMNELGRDLRSAIKQSEDHVRDMVGHLGAENDKRSVSLQLQLTQAFPEMAEKAASGALSKAREEFKALAQQAAKEAIKDEREAERKAREDVENKAKDAVRGFRLVMMGRDALIGAGVVMFGLFIVKMTLGWSPFG